MVLGNFINLKFIFQFGVWVIFMRNGKLLFYTKRAVTKNIGKKKLA